MVRALLSGRKTVTRRLVRDGRSPFVVGRRIWVKETFYRARLKRGMKAISKEIHHYAADGIPEQRDGYGPWKKRSSLLMPRTLSRMAFRILSVRNERLQEITAPDACREGAVYVHGGGGWTMEPDENPAQMYRTPLEAFRAFWRKLHGDPDSGEDPWDANPEVTVISLRETLL